MTLEQLKELKKKSDELVETLHNDRVLIENTVNKIKEDNSNDFQEFLDSLKEYAKLLPEGVKTNCIGTINLFGKFDKHVYSGFWDNDTWVRVYENSIHFLCSNGDEEYHIDISLEKAECYYPSSHHNYTHIYFDDFKKFILEHKEEFTTFVEQVTEKAIENYVTENKKQNDDLYKRAEELNK